MIGQFVTTFLFVTAYAVIRYAGFGNVSLIHVPVYIMNKAVSMTAVVAMLMAVLSLKRSERDTVRFWTKACSNLVFIHVFLSLGILSKGYFAKFFDGDKMSLTGELVLLQGVTALYCFWRLSSTELKPSIRRWLTILASTLVGGHLFVMGFDGWLQVQKWNGGMPPITLLSFLVVMCSTAMFLLAGEKNAALLSPEGGAAPSKIGS